MVFSTEFKFKLTGFLEHHQSTYQINILTNLMLLYFQDRDRNRSLEVSPQLNDFSYGSILDSFFTDSLVADS